MSIAVEITGSDDTPPRRATGDHATADDRCAVHLPDRGGAVDVLPQNVGGPIAVLGAAGPAKGANAGSDDVADAVATVIDVPVLKSTAAWPAVLDA